MFSWTRADVSHLIEQYQKWPNLWRSKSINYKNRNMRRSALDAIQESFKDKPGISHHEIQNKFQALKQTAAKELKKMKESMKSGAGDEDIYEPSLWYFNELKFIFTDNEPRVSFDSIELATPDENPMDDTQVMVTDDEREGVIILEEEVVPEEEAVNFPTTSNVKKRKHAVSESEDMVLNKMVGALSDITNCIDEGKAKRQNTFRPDVAAFGEFVKAKLNKIEDDQIQEEVELEIHEALHRGLMKFKNK